MLPPLVDLRSSPSLVSVWWREVAVNAGTNDVVIIEVSREVETDFQGLLTIKLGRSCDCPCSKTALGLSVAAQYAGWPTGFEQVHRHRRSGRRLVFTRLGADKGTLVVARSVSECDLSALAGVVLTSPQTAAWP